MTIRRFLVLVGMVGTTFLFAEALGFTRASHSAAYLRWLKRVAESRLDVRRGLIGSRNH